MDRKLLKTETPKAIQMNKPLVLIVLAIALLIVGVAIIGAFQEAKPKTKTISTTQNLTPVINSQIQKLPQSYQEVGKIHHYMNGSQSELSPAVQRQLSALRQEQIILEQRLARLNHHPVSSAPTHNTIREEQAESSGLFFAGSAPAQSQVARQIEATKMHQAASKTSSPIKQAFSAAYNTPYNKQNMQLQNMHFLKPSEQEQDVYNLHTLVKPASPYEVQAGTLIPAELITGINTSLPGEVVAQVRENIYDSVTGRFLLIPKGSKLLGQYNSQIAYGQARVLIAFTRVIRPDGSSILLDKMNGSDLIGQSGMKGEVNNHWMRVIGAATLSTILSMGAGVASDQMNNNSTYYRSAEQNAVLGGANNISQVGQDITNRAINIQPTLTISSGYEFNVIVNKDMILQPYQTMG